MDNAQKRSFSIKDFLVYILLSTLYCTAIISAILSTTKITFSYTWMIFLSFLFLSVFYFILYNKLTTLITLVSLSLVLIAFFSLTIIYDPATELLANLQGHLFKVIDMAMGRSYDPEYDSMIIISSIFLGALLTTIFMRKLFSFAVLFALGGIVFFAELLLRKLKSPISFILFLFVTAVLFLTKAKPKGKKGTVSQHYSSYAYHALPVCLAAVCIALLVTTPFSAETGGAANVVESQNIRSLQDVINYFLPASEFSLARTGFTERDGKLGGDITLDYSPVMRVDSPNRLYLKGSVKETYDGEKWTNPDKEYNVYNPEEDYERFDAYILTTIAPFGSFQSVEFQAINQYDPQYWGDGTITYEQDERITAGEDEFNINFENGEIVNNLGILLSGQGVSLTLSEFMESYYIEEILSDGTQPFTISPLQKTSAIFYPNGTMFYSVNDTILTTDAGTRKSENTLQIGGSYSGSALNLNLEAFASTTLYNSEKGFYNEFREEVGNMLLIQSVDQEKITGEVPEIFWLYKDFLSDYFAYIDGIYDRYTALPDTLPQRVTDLAFSIAQEHESNYEKVKALEKYLKDYTYTLTPGDVPAGEDFVDYFLFENKSGYCTYFASAMCVLTRALGIPARYVEGYVTPSEKDSSGAYTVTNAQAHAWIEVYFEGVGWLQFEPTAPYASSFYDSSESVLIAPEMQNNPDFQAHLEDTGAKDIALDEKIEVTNNTSTFPYTSVLLIAGILAVGMATVPLLYFLYRYHRKKRNLNALMDARPGEFAAGYFREILKLTSLDGYAKYGYETPLQYAGRCAEIYRGEMDFEHAAAIYAKASYSDKPITREEKNILFKSYLAIRAAVLKRAGKLKFFRHYILRT